LPKRHCKDCIYGVPLRDGRSRDRRPALVCINTPRSKGELSVTTPTGTCRSFGAKRARSRRTVLPAPPDESVRYVPLTKGKFAIVDAADYERVSRYKWCASGSGDRWYAVRNDRGRHVSMHRFLIGAPKGMVVDHIDGNGLNNRQNNLRICTQRQNLYNSRPKGKSSRFKGVCRDKNRGRWIVLISNGERSIHVGRFDDEVQAARAYDRKAFELFGEFAYLNFPDELERR
jgi:hypothetical protein